MLVQSSCLQEGPCLIYVYSSQCSPVVCRRAHVLFTSTVHSAVQLFVGGPMSYLRLQFTVQSSCLWEGPCLIYVYSSQCSPVACRRPMSYLHCLCLLACSCVQHILCCAFVLLIVVLCAICCLSLDCPFLICPFGIL